MDLNQKLHIKLAPLNSVSNPHKKKPKDLHRLKGGSTSLMYACQQGLTDTIVKEIRLEVNVKKNCKPSRKFSQFWSTNIYLSITCFHKLQVSTQLFSKRKMWVTAKQCLLNALATGVNLLTNWALILMRGEHQ